MDLHAHTEARALAHASPETLLRSPPRRQADVETQASPCAVCTVRHLCLPGTLDEESRKLLQSLTIGRRRVRKGQKLHREGEPFQFVYAVRVGTFKSSLSRQDGREQVTSFHMQGDLIGFDGLANGRHPTTATALDNAEVCAIPYAQVMEVCAESRPLRHRLAQMMAIQLVGDCRSMKLVAGRGSEQRVAGFLLQLAGAMKERGYSPREFELRMSRAEIGSYLGTTLETVSRCLSAFARRGLISVRRRRIEVLQPEELLAQVERAE